MEKFFYPESIAVIGVSNSPSNMGRMIVTNLMNARYKGLIYSVGPKGGVLFGQSIRNSVEEIPGPVDLAVILTPAKSIPAIMDQCGRKGIKRVVIESSGFTEFKEDRKDLEAETLRTAQKWGIRFIGPNGIGIINTDNGVSLPFVPVGGEIQSGHVAVLAQSGGVGLSYLNFLRAENLGLSKFVSMGNKLNTDESDLLEYLINDPQTHVIIVYLEDIKDGRRLVDVARSSSKPILIHKANVGEAAKRIAASHTAALTSDDKVVSAAFRQAGIIRVKRFQTTMNYVKVLSLPPLGGSRLGIVSRSGGHAVIAADACDQYGFTLPSFSREFLSSIEKHFRASVIKLDNPLDLGDLFELPLYVKIVDSMLSMPDVDGVLLVHAYTNEEKEPSRNLIRQVEGLVKKTQKPVGVCVVTADSEISYVKRHIDYPIFTSPEEAAEALYLSYMKEWWSKVHEDPVLPITADKDRASDIINAALENPGWLSMAQGFRLLDAYGVSTIAWREAHNEESAVLAAEDLGYPVVLKADLPTILHKTEEGAVRLNIPDSDELRKAYNAMSAKFSPQAPFPAIIQKMASPGREMILGAKRDNQFGPLVILGFGGIFVEALDDITIRLAPITRRESLDMTQELKGRALLSGLRGQQPADVNSLADSLIRLSHLVADFPAISEVDINPFMLQSEGEGGKALDVRIKVSEQCPSE